MYKMIFKGAVMCVFMHPVEHMETTHLTVNRGTLYRLGLKGKERNFDNFVWLWGIGIWYKYALFYFKR